MKFDIPIGRQSPAFESHRHWQAPSSGAFFKKKKVRTLTVFFTAAVLYVVSAIMTGLTAWNAVTGIPRGLYWLIRNFFPSAQSLSVLPLVFKTSLYTAVIAITASTIAFCVACIVAVAGSQTTGHFRVLRIVCSGAASFFRNIPLPAWSILLLLSFKQNAITGFLALFFITAGHLTRAFTEIIDSHAEESYTALEAAGVPYMPIIIHGVLPNVLPLFISWLLYAIETNVRDSALIGILTGTGIGFLFNLYFKSFRYPEAGLIICVLMILVLCIDSISNRVRRILL
ncbi:ABC transporter permease subunit [Treponema medium]|uniref:ABC transporter permease subunit n=1 Tax=Treponema medium TaxID=58231 RepID=UPI00197EB4A0|nr:ABC transporter permease subunit [Treponema medium]QSH91058.1 ABC transporter permease subunit [Treponema medium]